MRCERTYRSLSALAESTLNETKQIPFLHGRVEHAFQNGQIYLALVDPLPNLERAQQVLVSAFDLRHSTRRGSSSGEFER
jgi:hypothetical protein